MLIETRLTLAIAALLALALVCFAQTQVGWDQVSPVGGSGGLAVQGGSLDLVLAVVPRKTAFNDFTGLNQFENGVSFAPGDWTSTQPGCTAATRFTVRGLPGATGVRDQLAICISTDGGASYAWVDLLSP